MTSRIGGAAAFRAVQNAALAIVLSGTAACAAEEVDPLPEIPPPPASVRGTLRVTAHGRSGDATAGGLRHVNTWVNGPLYDGMEDVDLRGYLDGRFLWGWNQATQGHVRVGRRNGSMRMGEYELFRNVHRWADIDLPDGARVLEARMQMTIEEPVTRPLDVMIYALQNDFDPGGGGELRNNNSPPLLGEVWWRERARGRAPWGHAGAGYASDTDPLADTPVMALAEDHIEPGATHVVFESALLARYIEERTAENLPLLFLIKLSDPLEDVPGALVVLYSGEQDAVATPARRPTLTLTWEAPGEVLSVERPVHLEYGRTWQMPRMSVSGARTVAVSFEPDEGHEAPQILLRGGNDRWTSPWLSADHPIPADWTWIEVRARAVSNPVVLGTPFQTSARDTWVISAPPEEQSVIWRFTSPQGRVVERRARYEGDYTWTISFTPDELGRWRYVWSDSFAEIPYRSADGFFDVVVEDLDDIERGLRAFLARADTTGLPPNPDATNELHSAFWKLERAVFRLATPTDMETAAGDTLYDLITRIRTRLAHGAPVPDTITPTAMERAF